MTTPALPGYAGHRFPAEVISHAVWQYFRFPLGFRMSEAKAEAMPAIEHRKHKGLNNREENSHQPTRLRERAMRRFKSAGHAQRFLSAFGVISSHFRVGRHLYRAGGYREVMRSRCATWGEVSVAVTV